MKTYQKPETEIVLLTIAETVMDVIETVAEQGMLIQQFLMTRVVTSPTAIPFGICGKIEKSLLGLAR